MSASIADPNNVISLVAWLRAQGHEIAASQIADLQFLFLNLQQLDSEPKTDDIAMWSVPILAQNSSGAELLKRDIQAWSKSTVRQQAHFSGDATAFPEKKRMPAMEAQAERKNKKTTTFAIVAVILATLLAISIASLYFLGEKELITDDYGELEPTETGNPSSDVPVDKSPKEPYEYPTNTVIEQDEKGSLWEFIVTPVDRLTTLLLLGLGVLTLWRRAIGRSLGFMKQRAKTHIRGQRYHFGTRGKELMSGRRLTHRLREFRIPQLIESHKIDVSASLKATRDSGGIPTIREKRESITPEYLLLIERHSQSDHIADLGEQLHQKLLDEHVFIDRYEFHLNPRRFLRRSAETQEVRRSLSIDELASTHKNQRLMIISDGWCFLDEGKQAIQPWLEDFSTFGFRTILTPRPQEIWDWHEQVLMDAGFFVLPTNRWGVGTMIDMLVDYSRDMLGEQQKPPTRPARERSRPLPHILEQHRDALLSSKNRFSDTEMRNIMRALRAYLRGPLYYWLMACAVFPSINPRLTLHLGRTVDDDKGKPLCAEDDPIHFLTLARLPWFQAGFIPDWMREILIKNMPESLQHKVIQSLSDVFNHMDVQKTSSSLSLEFIKPPKSGFEREDYKKIYESASDEPSMFGLPRDYLFLGFMSGENLDAISIEPPKKIKHKYLINQIKLPFAASVLYVLFAGLASIFWWTDFIDPTIALTGELPAKGLAALTILPVLCFWYVDRRRGSDTPTSRLTQVFVYSVLIFGFYESLRLIWYGYSNNALVQALPFLCVSLGFFADVYSAKSREPNYRNRFISRFTSPKLLLNALFWFILSAYIAINAVALTSLSMNTASLLFIVALIVSWTLSGITEYKKNNTPLIVTKLIVSDTVTILFGVCTGVAASLLISGTYTIRNPQPFILICFISIFFIDLFRRENDILWHVVKPFIVAWLLISLTFIAIEEASVPISLAFFLALPFLEYKQRKYTNRNFYGYVARTWFITSSIFIVLIFVGKLFDLNDQTTEILALATAGLWFSYRETDRLIQNAFANISAPSVRPTGIRENNLVSYIARVLKSIPLIVKSAMITLIVTILVSVTTGLDDEIAFPAIIIYSVFLYLWYWIHIKRAEQIAASSIWPFALGAVFTSTMIIADAYFGVSGEDDMFFLGTLITSILALPSIKIAWNCWKSKSIATTGYWVGYTAILIIAFFVIVSIFDLDVVVLGRWLLLPLLALSLAAQYRLKDSYNRQLFATVHVSSCVLFMLVGAFWLNEDETLIIYVLPLVPLLSTLFFIFTPKTESTATEVSVYILVLASAIIIMSLFLHDDIGLEWGSRLDEFESGALAGIIVTFLISLWPMWKTRSSHTAFSVVAQYHLVATGLFFGCGVWIGVFDSGGDIFALTSLFLYVVTGVALFHWWVFFKPELSNEPYMESESEEIHQGTTIA